MNKFQKSLDRIKKNVPLHEDSWTDEDKEHIITIIEALEKQIPKKPYYFGDGYADGMLVYDEARCPDCECDFEEGMICMTDTRKINLAEDTMEILRRIIILDRELGKRKRSDNNAE